MPRRSSRRSRHAVPTRRARRRRCSSGLRRRRARRRRFGRSGRSSWSSGHRRRARQVVDGGRPASDLELEIARARPRRGARAASPGAARRPAARLPGRPGLGARVRGEGGGVHPDHRRPGTAVLRLPRVQRREAAGGQGARARLDRHPVADGERVPAAGPLLEVLRPRSRGARRGRPRHGRAARHVRARLHGEVLRGHGVLRPRELLGQLQRRARAVHDRAAEGLAGDQLLLQHGLRREQRVLPRRAVVASGRLRPAARRDRPRLPLERVPGRHRRRERVEPDRGSRPRLPGGGAVLGGDRAPGDARLGAEADARDRLPLRARPR